MNTAKVISRTQKIVEEIVVEVAIPDVPENLEADDIIDLAMSTQLNDNLNRELSDYDFGGPTGVVSIHNPSRTAYVKFAFRKVTETGWHSED